jgi:hypothetical protein
MNEAEPGDLRTGQCADQPPGPRGQNRDRAPCQASRSSVRCMPGYASRGRLQGSLLELFKDQTLELSY